MTNEDSTTVVANDFVKPFSEDYVLRTTVKHARKSIDISIKKTFERIREFDGDQLKSREIFKTLAKLHAMHRLLDEFQKTNEVKA